MVEGMLGRTKTVNDSAIRTDHAPVRMIVPFAASSVPLVRRRLDRWMAEAGCSAEQLDDARIVLSELVANSVRHAHPLPDGKIAVSWSMRDGELEITVTDGGGPTEPRKVAAHSFALAGRGIAIIETLAASWWTERTRSRTTVYARLSMV